MYIKKQGNFPDSNSNSFEDKELKLPIKKRAIPASSRLSRSTMPIRNSSNKKFLNTSLNTTMKTKQKIYKDSQYSNILFKQIINNNNYNNNMTYKSKINLKRLAYNKKLNNQTTGNNKKTEIESVKSLNCDLVYDTNLKKTIFYNDLKKKIDNSEELINRRLGIKKEILPTITNFKDLNNYNEDNNDDLEKNNKFVTLQKITWENNQSKLLEEIKKEEKIIEKKYNIINNNYVKLRKTLSDLAIEKEFLASPFADKCLAERFEEYIQSEILKATNKNNEENLKSPRKTSSINNNDKNNTNNNSAAKSCNEILNKIKPVKINLPTIGLDYSKISKDIEKKEPTHSKKQSMENRRASNLKSNSTNSNNNNLNQNNSVKNLELDDFKIKHLRLTQIKNRKERLKNIDFEVLNVKQKLRDLETPLKDLEKKLQKQKNKYKENSERLMNHYKKLLYSGLDTRQEGLIWIIKAIWRLGEDVPVEYFPSYLDSKAKEFLFDYAQLSIDLEKKKDQALKVKQEVSEELNNVLTENNIKDTIIFDKGKNNKIRTVREILLEKEKNDDENNEILNTENNTRNRGNCLFSTSLLTSIDNRKRFLSKNKKNNETFSILTQVSNLLKEAPKLSFLKMKKVRLMKDINQQIEDLQFAMESLKNKELNRIFKEFIENNYQNKYNVIVDVVIAALFGEYAKMMGMLRYEKMRKDYKKCVKSIRFFDCFENGRMESIKRLEMINKGKKEDL